MLRTMVGIITPEECPGQPANSPIASEDKIERVEADCENMRDASIFRFRSHPQSGTISSQGPMSPNVLGDCT